MNPKKKNINARNRNIKSTKNIKSKPNLNRIYLEILSKYFEKSGFFIFLTLLSVIILFVFKDFILLNKLYLFKDIGSDSINMNYPGYFHNSFYLYNFGIPKWSFSQGMGQNIFPFSIPDPYTFLLMLSGPNNVAYGTAFMEISKIASAGLLFYLFLKKLNISNYASIIGGLLYAFNGFIILGSCWTGFSTETVYFALFIYSFEKLYQDNNWIIFPISILLITISIPFDLFLLGLFLIIYIFFRLFSENKVKFQFIYPIFLKIIVLGLIGLLLSSFFLINDIIQMLNSPRVSGDSSFFSKLFSKPIFGLEGGDYGTTHYLTALMRLFSNDMLGNGAYFKGWYNYLEAPLFYCGLISTILFTQIFNFLDKRSKIIYCIFFAIFFMPIIFPFFRYAFWLFSGNYYRVYSIFVVFVLLLFTIKSIHLIETKSKMNHLTLIITFFVLLFLLYFPYQNKAIINPDLQETVCIYLIVYFVLILLFHIKSTKNIIKILLLFTIVFELIRFSNETVNTRPVITGKEFKSRIGYNDYTIDAVKYLKSKDKSFFRISKDYSSGVAMHTSMNDAKVQNFYGTQSYNSFNQFNYIEFLQETEVIQGTDESQTRWCRGVIYVPLLHSFASLKYALSKTTNPQLLNFNYDSITTIGDVKILRNKYPLPLGFTYDKYMTLKEFKKLPKQQKHLSIYKAVIINDSIYNDNFGLEKFDFNDTIKNFSWQELSKDITLLKTDTVSFSEHGQNKFVGKINLDKKKMVFFSIPYDDGWKAKVNGKSVETIMTNIGFTGIPLSVGNHTIELEYNVPYFRLSLILSLVGIVIFIMIIVLKQYYWKKNT